MIDIWHETDEFDITQHHHRNGIHTSHVTCGHNFKKKKKRSQLFFFFFWNSVRWRRNYVRSFNHISSTFTLLFVDQSIFNNWVHFLINNWERTQHRRLLTLNFFPQMEWDERKVDYFFDDKLTDKAYHVFVRRTKCLSTNCTHTLCCQPFALQWYCYSC